MQLVLESEFTNFLENISLLFLLGFFLSLKILAWNLIFDDVADS